MMKRTEPNGRIAVAIGPTSALLAAGLLSRFRDEAGAANVALVLATIVLGAALAGRLAGAITAVTAALSYNFFHTRPYNSLQISSLHDAITVALLAVIGLAVSELSSRRRHAKLDATLRSRTAQTLERTSGMLAAKAEPEPVWSEVRRALIDTLHLVDCSFIAGPTEVPTMPRSGVLVARSMHLGPSGFCLPFFGAAIAVTYGTHTYGHILIRDDELSGSSIHDRQAAIALADQYAVALGTADAERSVQTDR